MALGEKKGFFGRLSQKLNDVFASHPTPDEDMLEELEDVLITSDLGVETTLKIIEQLRHDIRRNYIYDADGVRAQIKSIVAGLLDKGERLDLCGETPLVIVMIGVNGVGKTTSIGKLASIYRKEGKKVMVAAADTFRAAAVEQLHEWANRAGVDIIKGSDGQDPASVVFDALKSAEAKNTDILICDTAGRLHNKKNLMEELKKMNRIIDREYPDAHRENLIVLDGTTGQNAMMQAKEFGEVANLTGIILTKMDGTAKGGIAIAIQSELKVPVKYIGVGETIDDLQKFDSNAFVNALFDIDNSEE